MLIVGCPEVGPDKAFDSTVGDRESAAGTYREFVMPAPEAIYPEYAVIYERLYRPGRERGASRACALAAANAV